jgi:hypothetical protein
MQPDHYVIARVAGTVGVLRVGPDATLRPVRHIAHHSPTGFEYGYAGSGPADLARCLLGDYLGDDAVHPAIYQAFKRDVIAQLDGDTIMHRVEASTIAAWLETNEGAR